MDKTYPYSFTPISSQDKPTTTNNIVDEECPQKILNLDHDDDQPVYCEDECCGTTYAVVIFALGFFSFIVFCIIFASNHSSNPISNPTPPKFILSSLKIPNFQIKDGELSATWDVDLTLSNTGENSTLLNFLFFEAVVVYKENAPLAMRAPTEDETGVPGIFTVDQNENKMMNLKFKTTGWEREQPIVDDSVLQEIAKDRERGSVKFGLKIMAKAEFNVNYMMIMPAVVYPQCNDLEVKFGAGNGGGGDAAVWVNGQPMECSGPVQWGYE